MDQHILHKIDPKLLGERIAEARQTRQLAQQVVADALGLSRSTVIAIEKGKRRPTASELVALARLFGQSIQNFVGQESSGAEHVSKQSALQAYELGLLTIGQLAERLGTDILGARAVVRALTDAYRTAEERHLEPVSLNLSTEFVDAQANFHHSSVSTSSPSKQ